MIAKIPVQTSYHPEIQGLRTLSALLIAVFHIWIGRVSGGVDVFFVISGFLMTRGLVVRYQDGRFSFLDFWGGIIRRIAPVAYLILFVTLCGSLLILPQTQWVNVLSDFKYTFVHLENWHLLFNSVDYLSRGNSLSPLQHFWALSVQVQFYALWPFVIFAGGLIYKKCSNKAYAFASVIGTLFLLSFVYSIWATSVNQPSAYFNTFTRIWEFALGGLVYLIYPLKDRIASNLKTIMGWIGLAGIVSCGFVLDTTTTFPGYYALWPTLSAVLILLSPQQNSRYGVEFVLANRFFVAIGGISFAFYLWHWPILIFTREYLDVTQLSYLWGGFVISCSLILSILTLNYLERPVKKSSYGKTTWCGNYALGTLCALPLAVGILLWNNNIQKEIKNQKNILLTYDEEAYPGGRIALSSKGLYYPPSSR